jgi:hypothetical protein
MLAVTDRCLICLLYCVWGIRLCLWRGEWNSSPFLAENCGLADQDLQPPKCRQRQTPNTKSYLERLQFHHSIDVFTVGSLRFTNFIPTRTCSRSPPPLNQLSKCHESLFAISFWIVVMMRCIYLQFPISHPRHPNRMIHRVRI